MSDETTNDQAVQNDDQTTGAEPVKGPDVETVENQSEVKAWTPVENRAPASQ